MTQGRPNGHNPPIGVEEWMAKALCYGMDPNDFFPLQQSGRARMESYAHYSKAVAVCKECPVAEECLEYALERPSTEGIWGGTTQRERVDIRRARRLYATTDDSE